MKLLRDPLVHFVVAAALIFGLYQIWQNRSDAARSTIFISAEELERMAALYTSEAGALPTETDIQEAAEALNIQICVHNRQVVIT